MIDRLDLQKIEGKLSNIELSAYNQKVLLEEIALAIKDIVTLLVSIDNALDKSDD